MVRKQPERSVLITDAARSQDDQLRSRHTRYLIMMATRVGCLILGGVLISAEVPLLPVWLTLCLLGMVLLPWAAVLIANDRPPRERASRPPARPPAGRQALSTESAADARHRTIDVEP